LESVLSRGRGRSKGSFCTWAKEFRKAKAYLEINIEKTDRTEKLERGEKNRSHMRDNGEELKKGCEKEREKMFKRTTAKKRRGSTA